MKQHTRPVLFWAPRLLAILFAAFISIFALDVFGQGYTFWDTVVALIMHLVPTALILTALGIAWRWEWPGGLLFIALGAFYIFIFRNEGDWVSYLTVSGPLFLVGVLFLVTAWVRKRT